MHFERLKRIMRVQNISGQFTARKIDGAAKQEISAFKIASWSARNPALLRDSLKLSYKVPVLVVAPNNSMKQHLLCQVIVVIFLSLLYTKAHTIRSTRSPILSFDFSHMYLHSHRDLNIILQLGL